jgi:hypothetical protein
MNDRIGRRDQSHERSGWNLSRLLMHQIIGYCLAPRKYRCSKFHPKETPREPKRTKALMYVEATHSQRLFR